MIYKTTILAGILFFSGCSNNSINLKVIANKDSNSVPKWLDDPQKEAKGKITAVGCAGYHYKGVTAQKKLAVSRAIDEIATQVRVNVNTVTLREKYNGRLTTKSNSLQSVNNLDIKTKIMDYYKKPNGDICAWVIKK